MSKVRFRPFPSPLVFPGLQILAVQVFCTGIIGQAVRILADDTHCGAASRFGCRALAISAVSFVAIYETFTIAMVLRFSRKWRRECWKEAARPPSVDKVSDPLFRLVSRVRTCVLPPRSPWANPVDRPRGKFGKPAAYTKEPARTERLLARPYALWPDNAADTLDGIGFALMARAGGDSLGANLLEMVLLAAQVRWQECEPTPLRAALRCSH